MALVLLQPESIVREDGQSAEVALDLVGKPILLTLGITGILERETLEIAILGSADRVTWKRLAAFPKKSYCGTYSLPLDLSSDPHIRYLRVEWKMTRWEERRPKPVFTFYVAAQELRARVAGAA